MLRRSARNLLPTLALAIATGIAGGADGRAWAQEAPREPSAAQPGEIARWIEQLSSDSYALREDAAAQLDDAGAAAIDPLAAAADGIDPELTARATRILLDLARRDATAEAALQQLATLPSRTPAQREAALAELKRRGQDRLIAQLRRQGAEIDYVDDPLIGPPGLHVRLDLRWQGGIERMSDLAQLEGLVMLHLYKLSLDDRQLSIVRQLTSLQDLRLYYVPVGDGGLDHIAALPRLARVQLYGTDVTLEGVVRLSNRRPQLSIDRRSGGLLGISGQLGGTDGCLVRSVQPDSAAVRAGLRAEDLITQVDGRKIEGFADLTAVLGARAAGERIRFEFRRDGKAHHATVTLGEWP